MSSLTYIDKVGAKALLLKEDKNIISRKKFLERSFFDRFRQKKIYQCAEQCFFNEYLWTETESETKAVEKMLTSIQEGQVSDVSELSKLIPIIACYRPLYKTDITEKILEIENAVNNPDFTHLVKYAIREPQQELELQNNITEFGKLTNSISKKVKKQYEENSYPRWRYDVNQTKYKKDVSAAPLQILVAGCGTGSSAVYAALEQSNSEIYAVDLSKTRLAYAKRQAEELEIENMHFYCGDLLNIESLEKKFDYILVTGVLHHMEKPLVGLEKLLTVLKPGGVMHIGLYSELARKAVNAAKEYFAEHDIIYSPENLRSFREHVKVLDSDDELLRLALMSDFYSLSECRNMLFHEIEHQFSISDIKEIVSDFGLEFTGFVAKDRRLEEYYKRYPDPEDQLNLDLWDNFERKNPLTFIGMYEFTVHKPVE